MPSTQRDIAARICCPTSSGEEATASSEKAHRASPSSATCEAKAGASHDRTDDLLDPRVSEGTDRYHERVAPALESRKIRSELLWIDEPALQGLGREPLREDLQRYTRGTTSLEDEARLPQTRHLGGCRHVGGPYGPAAIDAR